MSRLLASRRVRHGGASHLLVECRCEEGFLSGRARIVQHSLGFRDSFDAFSGLAAACRASLEVVVGDTRVLIAYNRLYVIDYLPCPNACIRLTLTHFGVFYDLTHLVIHLINERSVRV